MPLVFQHSPFRLLKRVDKEVDQGTVLQRQLPARAIDRINTEFGGLVIFQQMLQLPFPQCLVHQKVWLQDDSLILQSRCDTGIATIGVQSWPGFNDLTFSATSKKAVAAEITESIVKNTGTNPHYIYVIFEDVAPSNWAGGGKLFGEDSDESAGKS